jgi:hypothetical protein
MRRRVRLLRLFGLGEGFLESISYEDGIEMRMAYAAIML